MEGRSSPALSGLRVFTFETDVDILLRDTPAGFASACVDLLRSPAKAEQIAVAARSTVERFYVRAAIVERIRDEIRGAIADHPVPLPLPS